MAGSHPAVTPLRESEQAVSCRDGLRGCERVLAPPVMETRPITSSSHPNRAPRYSPMAPGAAPGRTLTLPGREKVRFLCGPSGRQEPCKKPYNCARTNAENRPARYLQGRFFHQRCGTKANQNLSVFHKLAPENFHLPADRVTHS